MTSSRRIDLARKRTQAWHETWQASDYGRGGVLTNYPNTGKSYGFMAALAEREEPRGTILQPNRDLRAETAAKAGDDLGLEAEDLPSFPEESPLMDEASPMHSEEAEEWYSRGMPPRLIYERLPEEDVPEDDEYKRKIDSELGENELLVGDPVHAHLERAVSGRQVAMDDIDPYSSFVTEHDLASEGVRRDVMEYVEHHRAELLEMGADIERWEQVANPSREERDALVKLANENESHKDVPDTEHVTAAASRLVNVLADTSEPGVDRAEWEEHPREDAPGTKYTGARVGDHVITAGLPLGLKQAENLLMMTATPVLPVFEQVFDDLRMSAGVYDSMTADQREAYFDDVLGADVVQTTRSSRFVSGGSNLRPEKFRLTVEEIRDLHGEDPLVISSKKAIEGGLSDAISDLGLEAVNFARAVGTNEFGGERLALVWGAPHYGDDYVRRVAAFCGDQEAEPVRDEGEETRWTTDTAQQIYENMCEGTVFQAMLRVGREADGRATVYVESDKIPDDVPRVRPRGRDMFRLFTEAEREVLDAASALGDGFTARDLHEATSVSRRTVYDVLSRLADDGAVEVAEERGGPNGADTFSLELECAGRGMLPESAKESLNNVIMQKPPAFERVEPTFTQTELVLAANGGIIPPEVEPEGAGEVQLDLGMFG